MKAGIVPAPEASAGPSAGERIPTSICDLCGRYFVVRAGGRCMHGGAKARVEAVQPIERQPRQQDRRPNATHLSAYTSHQAGTMLYNVAANYARSNFPNNNPRDHFLEWDVFHLALLIAMSEWEKANSLPSWREVVE